ncbi:MAG: LysE family translocator [Pseudomonadota bacterium]
MMFDVLFALVGFAFVSSITPGPNNLMLMASGANFGFGRTIPHMLGISIGHCFMIIMVGLGLIQLFDAFPVLHQIMTALSVAYLLFLAWKIANAAPPQEGKMRAKPLTFLQAAAFQWVNPKAWFMALTAITVYAPDQSTLAIALVAMTFALTNLPSICTWTVLGVQMRRWLTNPKRLRAFNWTMAACLVGTLLFLL